VTITQLNEVLNKAALILKQRGTETPRLDAEVLLAHCLGTGRAGIYARSHLEPETAILDKYLSLVERRGGGEPVAYLTGIKEFMGLEFNVTPAVLIPRPETELLVETALGIIKKAGAARPLLVDVGTGSGAIAVSIAAAFTGSRVMAVEISPEALEVARDNAAKHGVADRVEFFCGDLLAPLPEHVAGKVDALAANLPYIPTGHMGGLMPDVAEFEPGLALDGGEDGLRYYRRLIPMAEIALRPGGALLMETFPGQAEVLARLPGECWKTEILRDLAGRERLVVALFL
jgi:release factor glutamine methyltransferase